MNKLLLYVLLAAFCISLMALQTDEELSMHTFFNVKHALNRATHAGAQQLDAAKLAEGIPDLDPVRARAETLTYLRANLRLDAELAPEPGSFLNAPVEIVALDVIGAGFTFPYVYEQPDYGYSVTLNRPAVVLLVRLRYPRMYNVMAPVEWVVKSASELVL
ncbi:hypothetical protein [Gorillibacterium sp. sgz5001074]|uniref:hypothetical protein n=1 Tax=Gorillibacterium sp. sgz5001074 TaxID=3446695 RepID=UPI003F6648B8